MKLKLIDVETDVETVQTGTCELCYGSQMIGNPVYIFEKESDGVRFKVNGTYWDWGFVEEIEIDNIIKFASYVSDQEFKEETEFDYGWLENLVDSYDKETSDTDA